MDEMTIEHWQDPKAPEKQGLKLSGGVTIAQAAELKEALLNALGQACELTVELSGLTDIDLTGLQLLGAAHRSAVASGKRFVVEDGGNRVFLDTVEAAGFRRQAGCNQDTEGTCIWLGGVH